MSPNSPRHSHSTQPVRALLHGIEVEDPFRWLEDQHSSETRKFIQSEQQRYRDYLDRHRDLRTRIGRRVTELLTVETVDLPVSDLRGGLLFLKREAQQEQKAIYRLRGDGAQERLLSVEMLDRNSSTSLAILEVSPSGRYMAVGIRTGGEDVQEIAFYDLSGSCLLPDCLPRGFCRGLVFDLDGTGLFYIHEECDGQYGSRRAVRHHVFGQHSEDDDEVYCCEDRTADRLLLLGSDDGSLLGHMILSLDSKPEIRLQIHRHPFNSSPEPIALLKDVRFAPRIRGGSIEALTTYGAPQGRIVSISLDHPEPEEWRNILAETDESIQTYERCGDLIVVNCVSGIRTTTRIYGSGGDLLKKISFPPDGTSKLSRIDVASMRLFYSHSDVAEPPAIYSVNLMTGEHTPWWQQETPAGKLRAHVVRSAFASKNGTMVPITLIHPEGRDGPRPILLTVYGGAGVNSTPKFGVLLTLLLEAGFSYATAHVRGGGEGGPGWHLAGRRQRKQTSVDDLIASAQWLIENGLTTPDHLGLAGQSNGALLTLCAVTQRPGLFRAALALGPLTDLTRFHLFGVGSSFTAELGSPDDPSEFRALYRMSPYHHVRRDVLYPAVLIISGDRDKRCDALHARKMIARLREAETQEHSLLLDYTETRGHKVVLPLSERIEGLTDRLTFLIAELGDTPVQEQLP
jgi:prolyl oligopeptidase